MPVTITMAGLKHEQLQQQQTKKVVKKLKSLDAY